MTDNEIHSYCLQWVSWCWSRKFYMKPSAQNILARMQPTKVGVPPNARNDPNMQFFNMAVHTLADMPEHRDAMVCFKLFYVEQADNVKHQASLLGVSRPTYYNRTKAFARKAYAMSLSLKTAFESMGSVSEVSSD